MMEHGVAKVGAACNERSAGEGGRTAEPEGKPAFIECQSVSRALREKRIRRAFLDDYHSRMRKTAHAGNVGKGFDPRLDRKIRVAPEIKGRRIGDVDLAERGGNRENSESLADFARGVGSAR